MLYLSIVKWEFLLLIHLVIDISFVKSRSLAFDHHLTNYQLVSFGAIKFPIYEVNRASVLESKKHFYAEIYTFKQMFRLVGKVEQSNSKVRYCEGKVYQTRNSHVFCYIHKKLFLGLIRYKDISYHFELAENHQHLLKRSSKPERRSQQVLVYRDIDLVQQLPKYMTETDLISLHSKHDTAFNSSEKQIENKKLMLADNPKIPLPEFNPLTNKYCTADVVVDHRFYNFHHHNDESQS